VLAAVFAPLLVMVAAVPQTFLQAQKPNRSASSKILPVARNIVPWNASCHSLAHRVPNARESVASLVSVSIPRAQADTVKLSVASSVMKATDADTVINV